MLQRLGVANPKHILQRFLEKRCPKLYPRKRLQRLPTKKSVAISAIATILGLLQHFLCVETGSKFSSGIRPHPLRDGIHDKGLDQQTFPAGGVP
jgi:hypothetical protein